MAVYRWIYANAKMEGNRKDYHVRMCDPALENYRQTLILLSNRLLSTDKRYNEAERQTCWFAGHVDEKMYVVAMGGDQTELLGVFPDGYRKQHCVLAYGFTGEDIRLYRRDDRMFEPLKDILREIQRKGEDIAPGKEPVTAAGLSAYVESPQDGVWKAGPNIRKSTEENDAGLWRQSLRRPVMTGLISAGDARKLLQLFPGGAATVMEDVALTCYEEARRTNNALRVLEEREEQKKKEKEKADKELKELERRVEASRKELKEIEAAKQKKTEGRPPLALIVLLIAVLFVLLFLWSRPFREWAMAYGESLLSGIRGVKDYYLASRRFCSWS
ncbi:MAG: hypothetical protein NC341_09135 [Blautia sp.]|nr:hypothetical protein [Blautia sp.]MCM1201846.1 hypothetical protein [Bacteroides fragilis]